MRIIAKSTLRTFWEREPRAEAPLEAWYRIVAAAEWTGPADVKRAFGSADFVGGNRVIFNIGGNKYRLILHFAYAYQRALIKFVGTPQGIRPDQPGDRVMDVRPIRTPDDLAWALAEVAPYFDAPPEAGTPEADRFDVLTDLIGVYEDRHAPIPPVDPIDVLRFSMEQNDRSQADLAALLGSRSRASEILSGKRRLTLEMIAKLEAEWHIPAGALVPAYAEAA